MRSVATRLTTRHVASIVGVTNEGEPLHTVTEYTKYPPGYNLARFDTEFEKGADAHAYARETKDNGSRFEGTGKDFKVTVTAPDGGTVEIKANGWSRVNA